MPTILLIEHVEWYRRFYKKTDELAARYEKAEKEFLAALEELDKLSEEVL